MMFFLGKTAGVVENTTHIPTSLSLSHSLLVSQGGNLSIDQSTNVKVTSMFYLKSAENDNFATFATASRKAIQHVESVRIWCEISPVRLQAKSTPANHDFN